MLRSGCAVTPEVNEKLMPTRDCSQPCLSQLDLMPDRQGSLGKRATLRLCYDIDSNRRMYCDARDDGVKWKIEDRAASATDGN